MRNKIVVFLCGFQLTVIVAAQDADLRQVQSWYLQQPQDFANEVLFEFIGTSIVRSSRYAAASTRLGDFDGDNDIDQHDYFALQICLSFSGPGLITQPACEIFDYDGDNDIDLADTSQFQSAFTGTLSGVLVEAGELFPSASDPYYGYYSGAPGTPGNNALNGIARQAGYSQDDLWYEWRVISKPDGSGDVIISNPALQASAFMILPPAMVGGYVFQLKVTNLVTREFGTDLTTLIVFGCDDSDCNDDNDCTDDVCNNGTCENNNNTAACSDGDACTTGDVCADGTCAGTAVTCPPGQQCNASTGNCQAIVCTSNSQCDDGFSCTTDTCNLGTGACVYTNIDAACDDNLFCTGVGEVCDPTNPDAEAGTGCVRPGDPCVNPTPICQESNDSCIGCTSNAQCDDGFSCTSDTCAGGACTNTPINTQCPDPVKCDGDDICDPNHAGADKTTGCYAPGNPCAPKVCHEYFYVVGDLNTCSDCTSNADCSDGITCTQDTCNGATGACNPPINDNTLCPNALFCDGVDICNPADPDANATTGCISGLTSNPPGGYPCGNACNEATNQCFNCTGNIDCSDNIACTDDLCNGVTFQCSHVDNCQGGFICNVQNGRCE